MTQFSLDALDLAALLSSRVCHDVISPVGAIVNGRSVPRVLMSKNKVKLLLNLCLMADAAIPRGGVISVSSTGEDERVSFRIEAKGVNARIAANIPALLSGDVEDGAIDARAIQPYYAGLVAKSCGLDITVTAEPELVTFDARPAEAAGAGDAPEAQEPQSAVA